MDDLSLAQKVMGAIAAIATPIFGIYKWADTKLEKKADKAEVDRHRDYFVKVFEKMDEHQKSDTENFREITRIIHQNHSELLRELSRKEDR